MKEARFISLEGIEGSGKTTTSAKIAKKLKDKDKKKRESNVQFTRLERRMEATKLTYKSLTVDINRNSRFARFNISGPTTQCPDNEEELVALGVEFWPLRLARER